MKSSVRQMDLDEKKRVLLTVGQDRMVKLWGLKNVL